MKTQFTKDELVQFDNHGTSDGALAGWETRRRGARPTTQRAMEASRDARAEDEKKPDVHKNHHDHLVAANQHRIAADRHRKAAEDAGKNGDVEGWHEHATHAKAHEILAQRHAAKSNEKLPNSEVGSLKSHSDHPMADGTASPAHETLVDRLQKQKREPVSHHGSISRGKMGRMPMGRIGNLHHKKKKHGQPEDRAA